MVVPEHEMRVPPSLASTPSNSDESLLLDVDNTDIESIRYKRPNWFAIFLARFPYLVALGAFVVAGLCALSLKYKPFPDFASKPLDGFVAHGTYISGRSLAHENLRNAIGDHKPFSYQPNISEWRLSLSGRVPLGHIGSESHPVQRKRRALAGISYDPDTCGDIKIDENMFKVVFESEDGSDLFTLRNFQAICDFEAAVMMPSMPNNPCPRMHSLPFYTSVKFRKPCRHLTDNDVADMKSLLQRCYPFYEKKELVNSCHGKCKAPLECLEHGAVYKIFHYLTDVGFKVDGDILGRLGYTALFYNYRPPGDTVEYYLNTFRKHDLSNDYVKVTAVFETFHLKDDLFQKFLLGDLIFFGIALALILVILTVYMRSFALMLALVGNVGASFITAYAVYVYVFGIDFYPFINIISGLILIAIGADNVFVFYDAWKEAKRSDPSIPIENQVARTFNHAAVAIIVTSLTTAASFYANCITHIPAIRCFGVFAGTAVLANCLYMMTWTPAIVTFVEKMDRKCLGNCSWWASSNRFMANLSHVLCAKGLSTLIEKLWAVWLFLFCSLGIGGLIVVFYSPGLRLPTSSDFQLFPSSEPLERWSQSICKQFRFYLENLGNYDDIQAAYIWGVVPVDNRRWSDPDDKGRLVEDSSFDLFSAESQLWLKKFTREAANQSFVRDGLGNKNTILSTFEAFEKVLKQYCDNTSRLSEDFKKYILACCVERSMPFSRSYLQKCFAPVYIATSMRFAGRLKSGIAVFDDANVLKAFIMPVITKEHYSTSYEKMHTLDTMMDGFLTGQLSTAPEGLKNGFLSAYTWFDFYDLQQAISRGTYYSIALSLSVATVLMLVTSLNLLVTIYAIITITFAIAGTIGVLVLLGWQLNIIESITISLAVGLSIDFTIHYGVAYRLSREKDPSLRVREGFSRVGSAVVMAALTTFVAGAAVMPSHILAYSKLATFLMIVMSVSWLYATFFFQSLCRIIGPRGRLCQIPLPFKKEAISDVDLNGQDIYRQGDSDRANLVMDPLESEDDVNLLAAL